MPAVAPLEADVAAVLAECDRFISFRPRRPHEVLAALAELTSPDLEPDTYGRGSVVDELEDRVAALLGHEAAVVMPTGTMAQQIALRIWTERRGSQTVAFHPTCHLERHEEGGYARLHGLHARLVGHPDALIGLADLEDVHEPLGALLLELPQRDLGGRLPGWEDLVAQTAWARERGTAVHLDGARLWQCSPWYGREYAEIAGLFDSVYVSFYKDLGGFAGCALAGPSEFVEEARVWQVRHGGRLAVLWPIAVAAAAGLDRLPRMPAYYEKAVEVAAALVRHPLVDVAPDPPQTPMVHLFLRADADALGAAALEVARERHVWLFRRVAPTPLPGVQRLELTVSEPTLELATEEIAELFAEVLERAGSSA